MGLSAYREVRNERGQYAKWVSFCAGQSGVYVIRSATGLYLYVGESHTGNLRETLQRHFQGWSGKTAGITFRVEDKPLVAVQFTDKDKAAALQDKLIKKLDPIFNVQGKERASPTDEEVPF